MCGTGRAACSNCFLSVRVLLIPVVVVRLGEMPMEGVPRRVGSDSPNIYHCVPRSQESRQYIFFVSSYVLLI